MKAARILLISLTAALSACSNGTNATDAELELSRNAGSEHARKVLALPENSMEREKAIFAIRARETRLRDAGYEDCADAYIHAAAGVLNFPE